MKVSKRDLSIIMIILGLAAAFCAYQFYFRGVLNDRSEIIEQTESLKAEYKELEDMLKDQKKYVDKINDYNDEMIKLVKSYPVTYLYEDGIMYLRKLETEMDNDTNTSAFGVDFNSYTIAETAFTETITGKVGYTDAKANWQMKDVTFAYGAATISSTYECESYAQMKKLISDVYNEKVDNVPKAIKQVTMSFDQHTGEIKGSMNFDMYCLTDLENNKYNPTDTGIKEDELGLNSPAPNFSGIFGFWAEEPEDEPETAENNEVSEE